MGKVFLLVAGLALASAGVVLLVWLLWHLWQRSEEDPETPSIEIGAEKTTPEPEPPVEEVAVEEEEEAEAEPEATDPAEAAPVKPDDLKKLEGIGPKISSVLQAAGVTTYAQLADTSVDSIKQILEDEDPRLLRLADPTSWPDQAALAAAGEWDALKALQQELKGGRKS